MDADLLLISMAQIEADLLRRGLDLDFIEAKETIPGDVAAIVTNTEFLALQMRYGFTRAVAVVRAKIDLDTLERELISTRPSAAAMETALEASRVQALGEALAPTVESTDRAAYMRGAREGTQELRRNQVSIRFDSMNPHAAQYARTESSRLITQVNDSQREAVRNLIESSVASGRTVQETARDIRHVVGLRDDQVRALQNYRERITIRGKLTVDQIERRVRRYADALVRQRGELIARTEVLAAANAGQLESWKEAKRQGLLDNTYGKKWVTTPDELLCDACEAMDEQTVGFNEVFNNGEGGIAQFPPLHPNCRCSMVLEKLSD